MTHFNTTNLSGVALKDCKEKNQSQDEIILRHFRHHPNIKFGPSSIWRWFEDKGLPITSVRRAITNLTKAGLIEKTTNKEMGMFGRMEYTWQFKMKESLFE